MYQNTQRNDLYINALSDVVCDGSHCGIYAVKYRLICDGTLFFDAKSYYTSYPDDPKLVTIIYNRNI